MIGRHASYGQRSTQVCKEYLFILLILSCIFHLDFILSVCVVVGQVVGHIGLNLCKTSFCVIDGVGNCCRNALELFSWFLLFCPRKRLVAQHTVHFSTLFTSSTCGLRALLKFFAWGVDVCDKASKMVTHPSRVRRVSCVSRSSARDSGPSSQLRHGIHGD